MEDETSKKFVLTIAADEEFRNELENSKTAESALAFIKKSGFEFSMQKFSDIMFKISSFTNPIQNSSGELSDADLDQVSGTGYVEDSLLALIGL